MDAAYGDFKKARRVKKVLLTRSMNRLRTIVGRGKDAHADTINAARRRARDIVEELDEICKKMGTILQKRTPRSKKTKMAPPNLQHGCRI